MITNQIQKDKPLSELSTFGIGGPARLFLEVRKIPDMQEILAYCHQENIPFIIIGKGSNCLFSDLGYNGLVILNKIDFMHPSGTGEFHVGAGYSFSLLGVQTARDGWEGLEFASGIPASVGGAVFMNAGANGTETCKHLISVDFVHPNGTLEILQKSQLHFGYRESSFQTLKGAIVAARFALNKNNQARQKQLEIINYRLKTQPYKDKSAGCIFRNPPGGFAGQLIEQSGLKGTQHGGAKVSEMHANFIVNSKGAKAEDVINLINQIKMQVKAHSGFELMSEVRVIPYQEESV